MSKEGGIIDVLANDSMIRRTGAAMKDIGIRDENGLKPIFTFSSSDVLVDIDINSTAHSLLKFFMTDHIHLLVARSTETRNIGSAPGRSGGPHSFSQGDGAQMSTRASGTRIQAEAGQHYPASRDRTTSNWPLPRGYESDRSTGKTGLNSTEGCSRSSSRQVIAQ